MAEQIISPGVFTRENDQSFLPQGVGAIGAAIVGPTVKGPAFVPTVVRSFAEYERRFGGLSKDTFIPQTVREYLRNAGSVTVTRVLAGGGFTFPSPVGSAGNGPVALVGGNTSAPGAFATSSIVINSIPNNSTLGSSDVVTIDTINFTFVADPSSLTDSTTQIFVDFQDSTSNAAVQLRDKINASSLSTSITAVINTAGTVEITGSSIGVGGNVNILSSSGAGTSTFTIPLASLAGNNGGADAVSGDNTLLGLIYPSKNVNYTDSNDVPGVGLTEFSDFASTDPLVTDVFDINIEGAEANRLTVLNASINPSNDKYLFKVIGNSANKTNRDGYSYLNFKSLQSTLDTSTAANDLSKHGLTSASSVRISTISADITFNGGGLFEEGYSYASTPYIKSQLSFDKELFRFHSLGHGDECNIDYKISIANLKEPSNIDNEEQYSTFSVLIRKYNDTDKSPVILEQYNNCNLNPDSPNYIARVIGDRYPQYNDTLGKVELLGNYPNVSQLCRVEVSGDVTNKSINAKVSPKGFAVVDNPINGNSFTPTFTIPSASYEGVQEIGGNYNNRAYLGWKFDEKELDNKNFLKPIPLNSTTNVSGEFNVENYNGNPNAPFTGSLSASIDTTGAEGPTADQLKFTVPFQGGFDGIAPFKHIFVGNESVPNYGFNTYGLDLTKTTDAGYKGYKKAIDILSNQDEYDINMLALPGIIHSFHPLVTNAAIDMCEERGDTFFIMDLAPYDKSVNAVINTANGLDTNYAAAYYPWVKVLDTAANKPVLVPPSVIVPGAIAASDRIAAEWFAPAGLNRGVLGNVIEAKMRLNQAERDRLYNAKINPIATFPQTGVCIWGQKTLQERSSALDRINVRRLLIALKKFIASSSRYLVFEQNTNQTRNRFLNIVNPYLESVQQRQGLYSFRVQMDEANNTADVVDRNQLVGAIYLQPTKTAEFIVLDFNVLPTGATFDGAGGY